MKRVLVTFCACIIVAMLTGCEVKGGITDTTSENKMTDNSQTEVGSETQSSQDSQIPSEDEGQTPNETETQEGNIYDIYDEDKVIKEGCKDLSVKGEYIVYTRDNVRYTYMNKQGKDLLTVKYYTDFMDGRALVFDGNGVFYVDETLARVSDYIYEGIVTGLGSGTIKINNQFYLVSEK